MNINDSVSHILTKRCENARKNKQIRHFFLTRKKKAKKNKMEKTTYLSISGEWENFRGWQRILRGNWKAENDIYIYSRISNRCDSCDVCKSDKITSEN